ncbi:hypothetical protein BV22DRAFT_1027782 [Leucogyrophana mollusca]|uniref:Uncharacterized protein n=1 Tax=Leucogyrophana mollusca TaxID=85980 RepID=A0ACB8BZQ3_9AGAM|nr:hypothetical protein BV22DRAFT_1027782 [Leucogyrophana mollusca]
MPPPASTPTPRAPIGGGKKGEKAVSSSAAAGSKKKKETVKPAPKPKQPPKPRAKPGTKTKAKATADSGPSASTSKTKDAKGGLTAKLASRSRSASVMPTEAQAEEVEAEVDEDDMEDDKLYCVCKTGYDEDRVMIACDRCDEWYHTQCVDMPDLEVDLVDQFICPPCIEKYPQLSLRTTWKRRCLRGLKDPESSSPKSCHKPARGAFSKYCSDECGVKYMQSRMLHWDKLGQSRDKLWEAVKDAEKREGVVVCVQRDSPPVKMELVEEKDRPTPAKRKADKEVERLNAKLEQVVQERESMKKEMDMVVWRDKLVRLASERAEKVDECGWDQRLCFGEEEWMDFNAEVLDSYEVKAKEEDQGDDAMQVDGAVPSHGEWWCSGKKKCERHSGWQKLRAAEVAFDKDIKEGILLKLTTREREIRKGIEDILYPQSGNTSQAPPKPLSAKQPTNGSTRPHTNGEVSGKGKKKKS